MAFIKTSALISDIKGKLNGSYFQSKKNGITVNNINSRNKGKFQQNAAVQKQKGRVTTVSKTWGGLTEAQRLTWDSAASGMTRVNKNGVEYVPTGYQIFTEYNLNRLSIDAAVLVEFNPTTVVVDMDKLNIIPDATDKFVTDGLGDIASTVSVLIFATAPQSKGAKYARSSYRLIAKAAGGGSDMTIGTEYNAVFGKVSTGQTVFFKIIVVVSTSGARCGAKLTKADAG